MLYQLGSVTFQVFPVNAHEVGSSAGADFAAKDVMGVLRPREFTGEGDHEISIRGRLFPKKFGGNLDALHAMRRAGKAQILVRGDGKNFGWWVLTKVEETATYLDRDGVGQVVEFTVSLTKTKAPSASAYVSTLLRLIG